MPVTTSHRMSGATRRAQVLALATSMFAEHGYHHISMDDIADRAGASKPVLYRHFPSKLDLYVAVVDACGDALVAEVDAALAPAREAVPGELDGSHVVRAVLDAYVAFARRAGRTASLLFESDVTRDEAVRERVERPDRVNADAFAGVLVDLIGMDPAEAAVLARTCTAVARAAAAEVARADAAPAQPAGRSADPAETIGDVVSAFAWRGLRSFAVPGA